MGAAVVMIRDRWVPDVVRQFSPKSELGKYVQTILHRLPYEEARELLERLSRTTVIESALRLKHYRGAVYRGLKDGGAVWDLGSARLVEDYGLVCQRLVTTAGVNFLVDAFQNSVELENLKYHGLGTGNTAENASDTALVTELTTEYNPNSTRAAGSTTEGASANIYRTVGTVTVDASAAVVEHGVFSQAATGGGTLLDRSVFSVVNLGNGDSLQATYELTCTAGG